MAIDLARRLAAEGLLSDDELAAVVARRATLGEPVPVALDALGLASAALVARLFDRMGFAPAARLRASPLAQRLPRGMLRTLWVLPIGETAAGVVVAMADPTDAHAIAELGFHLGRAIDPRAAPLAAMRDLLWQLDPPGAPIVAPSGTPAETSAAGSRSPTMRPGAERSRPPSSPNIVRSRPITGRHGNIRQATPAYGEPPPHQGVGRVPSWGTIDRNTQPEPVRRISVTGVAISSHAAEPARESIGRALRESEAPIPLQRNKPVAGGRRMSATPVPRDALYTLAELRLANDRDAIARIVARGMTAVAQRAAFFVVKRGVVQGWEGATVDGTGGFGLSREALRNLWIPVTSQSVFRLVTERGGIYVGPLSDSTADSILAAALGGRARAVLLAPIHVRGHNVAFLYADGLRDPEGAHERAVEIAQAAAEALERWLVAGRGPR